jgi:hypothetical protein
MAQGKNNAAIAASLFLSERAVEKHTNAILSKLALTEEEAINRRVKARRVRTATSSCRSPSTGPRSFRCRLRGGDADVGRHLVNVAVGRLDRAAEPSISASGRTAGRPNPDC